MQSCGIFSTQNKAYEQLLSNNACFYPIKLIWKPRECSKLYSITSLVIPHKYHRLHHEIPKILPFSNIHFTRIRFHDSLMQRRMNFITAFKQSIKPIKQKKIKDLKIMKCRRFIGLKIPIPWYAYFYSFECFCESCKIAESSIQVTTVSFIKSHLKVIKQFVR